MGRRPELKSAELCDANVTVIEITSIFCLKPLKQVVQLLAARPHRRFRAAGLAQGHVFMVVCRPQALKRSASITLEYSVGSIRLIEHRVVGPDGDIGGAKCGCYRRF